jgi:hypothetical protein
LNEWSANGALQEIATKATILVGNIVTGLTTLTKFIIDNRVVIATLVIGIGAYVAIMEALLVVQGVINTYTKLQTLYTAAQTAANGSLTVSQWALNAVDAWDIANQPQPPVPPPAYFNKAEAVSYLSDTDWATIPDVADPTKSNPYLVNVQDYINYRNVIRAIAINPPEGFITWPTLPVAQWGTND